jgi:hypothetical protein
MSLCKLSLAVIMMSYINYSRLGSDIPAGDGNIEKLLRVRQRVVIKIEQKVKR